jgi:hypothetical protein
MLKMLSTIALVITLVLPVASKSKDKKAYFAVQVSRARYVAVVPLQGKDMFSQSSEDRRAQTEIEDSLREWKRFSVVTNPADADLIIAIHRKNLGTVKSGPTFGTGKRPGTATSETFGTGEDLFEVYRSDNTGDPYNSPPLWRYTAPECLASPKVPAFGFFRKAVEDAEK